MIEDTISAISTSLGASGVAVIRTSGKDSLSIAEKMFFPSGKTKVSDFEPYKLYVGEIDCGGFRDFGMCVYFKAPKSYTGEDIVEYHTHGGIAIVKGALKQTLSLGARLADNGEFTKRAFMNGKLSLSSAEGLIDMINSESEAQAKAGYYLYREKLNAKVSDLQDKLLDAISELDADMDFPEEDLNLSVKQNLKGTLGFVIKEIEKLLATFGSGRAAVSGVKVGIVGKPNTGKSSILNALLNYDKAIVSDIAGTTRDIVEGRIDIDGVKFEFSDTAGIRNSDDKIENLGVMLSKRVLDESDLIVFVLDGTNIDSSDDEIYELIKDKNVLVVLNKIDCGGISDSRADIKVSAKERTNIDELKKAIYDKTVGKGLNFNGDFLCEERHFDALGRARKCLKDALSGIDYSTNDLLAIDVKAAWDVLGEISGKTATEDIINNIFSKFCVGK